MISLIVATDRNGGIGRDNRLLWHLPNDLKHFKKKTIGEIVVMGRKTYESIGKLLPQRTNVIISRNKDYEVEEKQSYLSASSIEEILQMNKVLSQEIFVIGGGEIYKQLLPHADKIYLTLIEEDFRADTFFPNFLSESNEWKLTSKEKGKKDDKNPYEYYFLEYTRNAK